MVVEVGLSPRVPGQKELEMLLNILQVTLYVCVFLTTVNGFHTFALRKACVAPTQTFAPTRTTIRQQSSTQLHSFTDATTALIAIGDYAAEIEKATGTEIYSPIFKSGLLLFASGLISAFIAAFIVAKSNSWEALGVEFDEGKMKQLIELDAAKGDASTSPTAPIVVENKTVVDSSATADVKGFDL